MKQEPLRTLTLSQLQAVEVMYADAEPNDALLDAVLAADANSRADAAAEELAMNAMEWACNSEE